MNKISIGVDAKAPDTSAIEAKLNQLGQTVARMNKQQFTPVSKTALADLAAMQKRMEELVKTSGSLRQRLKATGQSGSSFTDWDWSRMYPDSVHRGRAAMNAYQHVVGNQFSPIGPRQPAPAPGPAGRPPAGSSWMGMGVGAAQAGLRAAGPIGGVASGAIGTGMSAGFGAGLMGLIGGIAALGVGKLVGAVAEKVDQAEANNVEFDKLKRILGDVGVSFGVLKAEVMGSAEQLKITYAEAGKLSQQFTKLANLSASQHGSLPEEMRVGVGMSRAFGLDPSSGVGVMGQMRGMGVTRNVDESRRFALLIGETIGKSNAFAKSEEVMTAIADFATSQTRNSMGAANVAGYAGMYSSMVGSGIPGMDPTSAAGLLSRVNSSLAAGGSKGEASQFFSGTVGRRMGLDSIQTQILREGGAFATNDEAFGPGSAAARFGIDGPGGNQTWMQGSMDELRRQYGGNKGLLAQATANHMNIGMRQAMALLNLQPNEMGEMQGVAGDLTKMSGTGIGNLSKAMYGTAGERSSIASDLLGRTGADAISATDRKSIEGSMGDDSAMRRTLSALVAKYDQERTTGSDIRDSKNALDNIKVSMADKVVPLLNEMRHGIMAIAGVGRNGTTSDDIMKSVIGAESDGRARAIRGRFDNQSGPIEERADYLRSKERTLDPTALHFTYRDKPEVLAQKLQERTDVQTELAATEKKLAELQTEKAALLKKENERRSKEIDEMEKAAQERAMATSVPGPSGGRVFTTGDLARWDRAREGGGGGGSGRAGYDPLSNVGSSSAAKDAMNFFMGKGWSKEQSAGIVANFVAESGLKPGASGDGGNAYGVGQWHPDRQADFASWAGKDIRDSTREEQYAFAHYEMTEGKEQDAGRRLRSAGDAGTAGDSVSRYYERPKERERDAAARAALARRLHASLGEGTQAPKALGGDGGRYDSGAVVGMPLPPLSGEMSVRLDLSPSAARLLSQPQYPMSTRISAPSANPANR